MITSSREARKIDTKLVEQYGIPSILLMENAGRSLVESLLKRNSELFENRKLNRILICCGKGNNGGDGFVMARRLQLLGISTEIIALGSLDGYQGDAAIQLEILRRTSQGTNTIWFFDSSEEAWSRLHDGMECADWLVDALLGTGSNGSLRSPYLQMIERMNESGKPIFAVDIPSGLDPEKGTASGPAVRARATCTLAVMKTALLEESAQEFTGLLNVGDIGISIDQVFNE